MQADTEQLKWLVGKDVPIDKVLSLAPLLYVLHKELQTL